MKESKGKQIEAHLKVWLLQGKTITHNQALMMWRTNRLSEYVRRCREDGMNIKTEMVTEGEDTYGVYSLVKKPKVDRIVTRQYMEQV